MYFMGKILIVEDDTDINRLLQKILIKEGYEIVAAFSGTEGQLRLSLENFDLMLCDLMLPGICGEELIKEIRKQYTFPIIALTAKGALNDKINVLELGADDYITKPFEPRELLARVQAQFRRITYNQSGQNLQEDEKLEIIFRDIAIELESRTVTVAGTKIELTYHEFEILKIMTENPKKVFSKELLYELIWKNGYYGEDNTISVHISNIRKKIAKVSPEEYISTVWGIGYRLNL